MTSGKFIYRVLKIHYSLSHANKLYPYHEADNQQLFTFSVTIVILIDIITRTADYFLEVLM